MNITTIAFPTPRSSVPTLNTREQALYRSSVQTAQENVMKKKTWQVTSDSATQGDVEIPTPFSVVLGGYVKRIDGVYLPITVLPKAGTPGTAVISAYPISTVGMITIYGR